MIALGSDHGGYELKEAIAKHLTETRIDFKDFGTFDGVDSVDYPDFAFETANSVAKNICELGILVCSTGIGISIAANKVKGIRAAVCCNAFMAEMTRRDNNANIVCLGGKIVDVATALTIVDTFLSTGFDGGRHVRRVDKITDYENSHAEV